MEEDRRLRRPGVLLSEPPARRGKEEDDDIMDEDEAHVVGDLEAGLDAVMPLPDPWRSELEPSSCSNRELCSDLGPCCSDLELSCSDFELSSDLEPS